MINRLCSLTVLVLSAAGALGAQAVRAAGPETAVVENKSIRIALPLPIRTKRPASESMVGFYAWRIAVLAPVPFTVVLIADTAMRTTDLKDILRASTLRMCPTASPNSLLDCVATIKAKTELDIEKFTLHITDQGFIARIRKDRPVHYSRSTIEPRGRVQLAESSWIYQDSRPR